MTITDAARRKLELNDAELKVIERAKELGQRGLAANAEHYDPEAAFPRENFDVLRSEGFLGVVVPLRFEGLGLRFPAYSLSLKELAKGCASTAGSSHMHNATMRFIDALGTEGQKTLYFDRTLENDALIGSWGAEPSMSWASEIALNTGNQRVDGGYRISGSKYFCSPLSDLHSSAEKGSN